jgi:diaminohydroxyphosphoribosylaminopyrimidine deaminase/5-amino-6-(5-phosphoribosylamino)uracil reductase
VVNHNDAAFMARALFLAERGRGRTSPNPLVGAVVVSDEGIVVGQGAHLAAGGPHAEVFALNAAGDRARGATLYCTLEPCSHTGRTGPCVERVVAAGIRRVVAGTTDRDPRVAGRGFAYLREHGVEVLTDVRRDAADEQNAPFFTWVTNRRPYVIAKIATSLDGFVGSSSGPVALTGAVANRYFHRQRAEVDAIAVGSGTILADDPLLTPRGAYRYRPFTRVLFDWRGRVPPTARVFSTLASGPVIMVVTGEALARTPEPFAALAARGVVIESFDERDVGAVLDRLARRDVVSLLVEGGPGLHSAFADARVVDRVQWIMTPRRLGHGIPAAPRIASAAAAERGRRTALGDDLLIEFDVHRTG